MEEMKFALVVFGIFIGSLVVVFHAQDKLIRELTKAVDLLMTREVLKIQKEKLEQLQRRMH